MWWWGEQQVPVIANTGTRVKPHLPWASKINLSQQRAPGNKQLASTSAFNRRQPS
jgi:hypothetical protein